MLFMLKNPSFKKGKVVFFKVSLKYAEIALKITTCLQNCRYNK